MSGPVPRDWSSIAARPRYETVSVSTADAGAPVKADTLASSVSGQLVQKPAADMLLRRAVELLAERPDGGGEVGLRLAGAIEEACGDGRRLATSLGLIRRPGQHRYETIARKANRDALIAELADRHYPGMTQRQQARGIALAIGRYRATGWLIDQHKPPKDAPGSERDLLHAILQSDPKCSFETIRRVLRQSAGSQARPFL